MIYKNKIRCKLCGDVIESKTVHDFKECSCGACFVDGGLEYTRLGWNPNKGSREDIIEVIVEKIKPKEYVEYRINAKQNKERISEET